MSPSHPPRAKTLAGTFQHLIYSPRGDVEGVLIQVGGEPVQLVFEHHGDPAAGPFTALAVDDEVSVKALAEPPDDKPRGDHAVYRFERLVSVNGRKPAAPAADEAPFRGTVVRLNFARHGEPNGVVLDSGHFIHTRPHGMAQLGLAVGDMVQADGPARPLSTGGGQVVEAVTVNGVAVE